MKKFNKNTAIILSCILFVVMVIGFLFTYVPIKSGYKKFVSFSGILNVSSDIYGGMYGEYDIVTDDPTNTHIVNSLDRIKKVFEEDGFTNVNIYAIGKEKIRVEVSYPRDSKDYADVYSALTNVGTGAFSLRDTYELTDESTVVQGSNCVDDVVIYTNNDVYYISIKFNEKGQEAYKALCAKTQTIYLALGEYAQSIPISSISDFSQFTLSDTDYDNLVTLSERIKLGCTVVEINSKTMTVQTMSANLSAGECSSSPTDESFVSSTALIVAVSAMFVVFALIVALFAARFGYYALVALFSMIFASYLFVGIMCLIPSVEIGLSGFALIAVGVAVIYTYAYMFASRVKAEYNQGKSLAASLQTALKKNFANVLIGNLTMLVSSLVLLAFAFGELSSAAIIFAICSFISLFVNTLFIPFLIKLVISFGNFGPKLFMLKKRSLSDDEFETKEAE